ncbi:MAG: FAD-dependent oxidoreductase, partial [Xanthobacteraceae bacterium]
MAACRNPGRPRRLSPNRPQPGASGVEAATRAEPRRDRRRSVQCCIVGGGPAGIMLGFLLARAGVSTVVLEKHGDFLRDFRGDTIHPSTLQIMDELGLLEDFLKRPHQRVDRLRGEIAGRTFRIADFTRLRTACPFIAFMPQWDFLNFLFEKGGAFSNFEVLCRTTAVGLLRAGDAVVGVAAESDMGPIEITADLTIGCDGRHSTIRTLADLRVEDIGAPIDVLWFRVGKTDAGGEPALLHAAQGKIVVTIDRRDYWQCAFVIPKGAFAAIKARGLERFRQDVTSMVPPLRQHVQDVEDWSSVKLLTVTLDRLKRWTRPGLLCIGDAAHAMSPVGGVGINLAIQDAVAAANVLGASLPYGCPPEHVLDGVRRRRLFPSRVIQAVQAQMHQRIIFPALAEAR